MKVQLLFPPHWRPTQPYLSLPTLSAFLKKNGFEVQQRDINVEFFDILLSRDQLQASSEVLHRRLESFSNTANPSEWQIRNTKRLFLLESMAEHIIAGINEAKRTVRSHAGYEKDRFRWASEIIASGLDLATAIDDNVILTFDFYRDKWDPAVSAQVLQAVHDNESFFSKIIESHFLSSILENNSDLVGISINSSSQVIPGLILARLIKQRQKNAHITLGGNHFSYIFDSTMNFEGLFEIIDSMVLFEGEKPLLSLLDCLKKGENYDSIANVITRKNSRHAPRIKRIEYDISSSSAPDFSGLPLHLYFSPSIVYPLQGSRGCYWKRCKFCDYIYETPHYRVKSVPKFQHEIEELSGNGRKKFFHLVDSAPSVSFLTQMATQILDSGENVSWATMCRFEKQLENPDLISLLSKSGCRVIEFGLESGSQQILDMIDKGSTLTTIRRVLENCKHSGIFTVVFLVIGLPGESVKDIEKTVDFITNDVNDLVDAISLNRFVLKRHSIFWTEACRKYGSTILTHPDKDWSDESPLQLNLEESELQPYIKKIRDVENEKPITKSLNGTLWDVSYLLQYLEVSGQFSKEQNERLC